MMMMSPTSVYSNKSTRPANCSEVNPMLAYHNYTKYTKPNTTLSTTITENAWKVESKERRDDPSSCQQHNCKSITSEVAVKRLPRTQIILQRKWQWFHTTNIMSVQQQQQENWQESGTEPTLKSREPRARSGTVSYNQGRPKCGHKRRLSLPSELGSERDMTRMADTDNWSTTSSSGSSRLICQQLSASEHRMFAIMTNVTQIIYGIAITQLGIVGTWYKRYMNFQEDQLRHVVYICLLFIIGGSYGIFVVVKRLSSIKSHRITYQILTAISITASSFIIANGIRMVVSSNYRSSETVTVVFDSLLIGLAAVEIPTAFLSLYLITTHHKVLEKEICVTDLMSIPESPQAETKLPPTWSSIFYIILNIAHIILGLCIIELGMVGMMYRRFMNIDSTGLFSVVFVSISFVSAGAIGIYNHITGKNTISCNRSMYTCASILAVGSATVILTFVSLTMANNKYYAGIEAIVAFDSMILSMSGIELAVGIAAMVLVLTPLCMSRLKATILHDNKDNLDGSSVISSQ